MSNQGENVTQNTCAETPDSISAEIMEKKAAI